MVLWSSDPGQGWQSHQPPCLLESEVPSAKLGRWSPRSPPRTGSAHCCSSGLFLPLCSPRSGFQAQEAQPPRTAFTERWWGCQKPGEDAGEHAQGSARGRCAWDWEGRGLYVWPSQQELPAGPVQSPGKRGPCHTGPITAPGGLTHS